MRSRKPLVPDVWCQQRGLVTSVSGSLLMNPEFVTTPSKPPLNFGYKKQAKK